MSTACNNITLTKEVRDNQGRIKELVDHYNSKKLTTDIYGKIDNVNNDSPGMRALDSFLKDQDAGLVLDESFILNDAQVRRLKLRLDEHEKQMRKPLGYLESIIKIPVAVMRKTPFAKDFYNNLDYVKNYERNKTVFQAQAMSEISTSFRLAYQEAGYKTGYFSDTAYKELAKLENEGRLAEDPQKLAEIQQKIKAVVESDEGAIIRDFNTLVTLTDKELDIAIKKGITGVKYGEDIEKKQNRLGKQYSPHIIDAVRQTRVYLNEMGKVNIAGLNKLKDAVWVKITGKQFKDNKKATLYSNELRLLNEKLNKAVERISIGMKAGNYYPNVAIGDVMQLKTRFNELLNAETNTKISDIVRTMNEEMDVMFKTDLPSNVKAKNDMIERRWSENPMFILEQYGAQAIQFNKLNNIALEYQKALKIINDPNIKKGGAKYMEGLGNFIHDEYTLATKGLQNRPEWLNDTVRVIKVAETIKAMGFGVTGAVRNVVSAQFFLTNMGLSRIRRVRDLHSNGFLHSTAVSGGRLSYSALAKVVGEQQGFEFKDIGQELVAEGILTKEGAEKLDFRWNADNGQIEVKDKGSTAWRFIEKSAIPWTTGKLLTFHRWGENYTRNQMYRMAFIEALEKYRSNPEYWAKHGGNDISMDNPTSKKVVKDAAKVALFAVNKFAGEYALHAKSRILTGHPGKVNVDGELLNKLEVGATTATSLGTGLLHYPMFFMDMQYNMIKGGAYSVMAKQWDSPELKYMAKYAAVYAFIQGLSVMLNTDLNRIAENDTISKLQSLYANIQGPDPDELNPDGTLKDNAKGMYGLINEITGPNIDDMFFLLMHNGVMNMPDSEIGRIAFGYDRYLETQNASAKDRAFWNRLGTFSGFMSNKAIPAVRDGRGWDLFRHTFAAYPSSFTKNSREWVGEPKEIMGIKVPGVPIFKSRKKKINTDAFYMKRVKKNAKGKKELTPLEKWRSDLEDKMRKV
jgi:hypothetical protein